MRRRLAVITTAAMMALAMTAAPAMAHPHTRNANNFVGPALDSPGAGAHNGIECAALKNKNIPSLAAVFECPSPNR